MMQIETVDMLTEFWKKKTRDQYRDEHIGVRTQTQRSSGMP